MKKNAAVVPNALTKCCELSFFPWLLIFFEHLCIFCNQKCLLMFKTEDGLL